MEGRELTEEEKLEIRAAIREIDPAKMAIIRKMTPAQRVDAALRLIEQEESRRVAELRARYPSLDVWDTLIIARGGPERYVACQLAQQRMGKPGAHLAKIARVLHLFDGTVDLAMIESYAWQMGCLDQWREWQLSRGFCS
jgi:hypothetical protein